MSKLPCVYLLASKRNGTLYVGVTSDLVKRMWEHKNHVVDGFTKQYSVNHWFGMKWTKRWNQPFSARRRSKSGSVHGS